MRQRRLTKVEHALSVLPQPATLIINPHQLAQSKAESTLIINSAGTAATLFTPATAFTPAKACTVPVSDSLQLGLSSSPVLAPTKQWAEPVVCFKCKMCGFLCLSSTSLRHHLIDDHEETGLESDLQHFLAANCSSRRNPTHLPGLSQYIQFWSQLQSAFKRGSWMGRCASRCRVWSQE